MIENLPELSEENLKRIYNSEKQFIESSEFKNIDGTCLSDYEELIHHLI